MNSKPSKTLIVLAFFAIYFIWGTTYLAALWGLEGMEPFVLSTFRYMLAGILLTAWCMIKKYSLPDWPSLKVGIIAGIVMLVGGSGLVIVAEKYIGSGHAAVVIATEPLWFLIFDRRRWKEYFSNRMIIGGLIIGFLGIAAFSYFTPQHDGGNHHALMGTLITMGGSILWVIGALYYERSSEIKNQSHTLMTAIQLIGAAIFSAMLALILGEWNELRLDEVSNSAWGGLIFLVIMGSIVAYMAFMWLMKVQPPALVSTHTYVNPVVAVFLGWLLADERITWPQGISLAVVLVGVVITQSKAKQHQ